MTQTDFEIISDDEVSFHLGIDRFGVWQMKTIAWTSNAGPASEPASLRKLYAFFIFWRKAATSFAFACHPSVAGGLAALSKSF